MFVYVLGRLLDSVRASQASTPGGAYLPPPPHCQWLILEHPASAGGGKYWLTPSDRLVGPGPPGSVEPLLGCGGVSGLCAPCSVCSCIAGCQRRLPARHCTPPAPQPCPGLCSPLFKDCPCGGRPWALGGSRCLGPGSLVCLLHVLWCRGCGSPHLLLDSYMEQTYEYKCAECTELLPCVWLIRHLQVYLLK